MKKQEENTKEEQKTGSETKKQKVSATYTLKALGNNARKLLELELITKDEFEQIGGIQKLALEHYIKNEMGIS